MRVMAMVMLVTVFMVMVMTEMDVKFDSADLRFLRAGDMQVPAIELQLFQFGLQAVGIDAKVDERADEHIAADAAEDVEIQGFHPL